MENYLVHFGTPKHSGRYPYGSGDDPYQGRTRSDRQPLHSRALERLTRPFTKTKRHNEDTNAKLASERKHMEDEETTNEIKIKTEHYKAIAEYYSVKSNLDELYNHYRKSRNEAGVIAKLFNSPEPKYQLLRSIIVDPLRGYAQKTVKDKLGLNDKKDKKDKTDDKQDKKDDSKDKQNETKQDKQNDKH